jgi:hypothetical protein
MTDYDLSLFLALQAERIRRMGWQRPTSAARSERTQEDVRWAPERQATYYRTVEKPRRERRAA